MVQGRKEQDWISERGWLQSIVSMIKAGDILEFRPEWMDEGDENITFIAVDDESKGRVTVEAQLGLPINPSQVVDVSWIQSARKGEINEKSLRRNE